MAGDVGARLSVAGLVHPPESAARAALEREKLVGQLASEKNRLHKVLNDGVIRLGVVVSDVHGQSIGTSFGQDAHRRAVAAAVRQHASRRLKASREALFDAVQGELTASHRFVLAQQMAHITHQLSRTIFVRLQQHQPYRDPATDCEALAVQRNAPRWLKPLTKFAYLTPAHA